MASTSSPDLGQRIGVQSVIHPATFPPVRHQAGILQDLEMERQPRLRRLERIGEVADAPLAEPEALQDGEPGRSERAWNRRVARSRSV